MDLSFIRQDFNKVGNNLYCSCNIHKQFYMGNPTGRYMITQNRHNHHSHSVQQALVPIHHFTNDNEFWIHRFVKLKYFIKENKDNDNNDKRIILHFSSPDNWDDPYETLFWQGETGSNQLSYIRCACFAFDMQYCEEAMWMRSQNSFLKKNSLQDQTICVSFHFEKLLELLKKYAEEKNKEKGKEDYLSFYVSIVDYSQSKKHLTKSNAKKLKPSSIEEYINLLSLKRKAYFYENELRVFAVFKGEPLNDNYFNIELPFDDKFVRRILMPPLFPWEYKGNDYSNAQEAYNIPLKTELERLGLKPQQSQLYVVS